jgi:protein-disulfide isomerase
VPKWRDLLSSAQAEGNKSARVTVIEFSDLECPFCRRFHRALRDAVTKDGLDVETVFIHYPLKGHRFAAPAARAAECAREQGGFPAFVDHVFEKQDSLGLKSWASFAREAGIRDTATFSRCAAQQGTPTQVTAGITAGTLIHVTGTPTVIINGWRFARPPYDSLAAIIRKASLGEPLGGASSLRAAER